MRSYCLMGEQFKSCKMKRILQMDAVDGCTAI